MLKEDGPTDDSPGAYALRMAVAKAEEVANRLHHENRQSYVLGADTIVVMDGDILGKPESQSHAQRMLERLAGQTHEVMTAVALRRVNATYKDQQLVCTRVSFRELSSDTIVRYVASGEGEDKAGAYAIQGLGAGLVERIEGSYSNVVGLPATQTLDLLMRAQIVRQWP